ncbi:hypothetical protein [Actinocatenispora rupis]|uniref:Uncharacterized protein n=1 Tax=Actinocatenispora rupis TaxID=519421 RepID=A0A8J3J5Z3_9ACTN|nr:hypothetical protein [Actinocatenispora rupis]GID12715.1 hypothetical protein Aru02nite_36040 [Actinocatenispora rupis]
MSSPRTPDLVPVLSRGKHHSPRRGACFMEMASYLAGEKWSDHPPCTHPLLAAVARQVNDRMSDEARSRLITLIPSVIGLTGDDLHVDVRIALRCATTALPVVAAERQRGLAVAVLSANRIRAQLDGLPGDFMEDESREALLRTPHARRWAEQFTPGFAPTAKAFRKYAAPATVSGAVDGIAAACVPDPDALLHELLAGTIADCTALLGRTPTPAPRPARRIRTHR